MVEVYAQVVQVDGEQVFAVLVVKDLAHELQDVILVQCKDAREVQVGALRYVLASDQVYKRISEVVVALVILRIAVTVLVLGGLLVIVTMRLAILIVVPEFIEETAMILVQIFILLLQVERILTLVSLARLQKWIVAEIEFPKSTSANAIIVTLGVLLPDVLDAACQTVEVVQVHAAVAELKVEQRLLRVIDQIHDGVHLLPKINLRNAKPHQDGAVGERRNQLSQRLKHLSMPETISEPDAEDVERVEAGQDLGEEVLHELLIDDDVAHGKVAQTRTLCLGIVEGFEDRHELTFLYLDVIDDDAFDHFAQQLSPSNDVLNQLADLSSILFINHPLNEAERAILLNQWHYAMQAGILGRRVAVLIDHGVSQRKPRQIVAKTVKEAVLRRQDEVLHVVHGDAQFLHLIDHDGIRESAVWHRVAHVLDDVRKVHGRVIEEDLVQSVLDADHVGRQGKVLRYALPLIVDVLLSQVLAP